MELEKVLNELSMINGGKYPRSQIEYIKEHKEEAIPFLRQSIDEAIEKKMKVTDNLHFYALYLLAEFEDQPSFDKMIALISLNEDVVDFLIGDIVTQDLHSLLYATFDGHIDKLKKLIFKKSISYYVKVEVVQTLIGLYQNQRYAETELKQLFKDILNSSNLEDLCTHIAGFICELHFIDMLEDVRKLYEEGKVDTMYYGNYDDLVDIMFEYKYEKVFCCFPIDTNKMLSCWAMFEKENKKDLDKEFEKYLRSQMQTKVVKKKIGRNDPCPCGSGKKYKKCCLNKPKEAVDLIEDEMLKMKFLKSYPQLRNQQYPDRIYIDDYFDNESIEIDKLIYLALHHRAIPIWEKQGRLTDDQKKEYLLSAFHKYMMKIKKEDICSMKAYDEHYAIHYKSKDWLPLLLKLVKNTMIYHDVIHQCERLEDFRI